MRVCACGRERRRVKESEREWESDIAISRFFHFKDLKVQSWNDATQPHTCEEPNQDQFPVKKQVEVQKSHLFLSLAISLSLSLSLSHTHTHTRPRSKRRDWLSLSSIFSFSAFESPSNPEQTIKQNGKEKSSGKPKPKPKNWKLSIFLSTFREKCFPSVQGFGHYKSNTKSAPQMQH